jgi:hypothetical protein
MDSIVKLEHQNKGDPVIQVCYLPIHPCVMKNHPQIVSTFPVQAFFKKNYHSSKGFIFIALQTGFIARRICIDDAEKETHFSLEGGSSDEKFQDVEGIVI